MTLSLLRCTECGRWQYPARSLCAHCLGDPVPQDHDGIGDLVAETLLHHSLEDRWQDRLPLRLGTVRFGPGADMLVILDPTCPPAPARVRVTRIDGDPVAEGA